MAVNTVTNNFGIENSLGAEASLSSDLVAQDLSELSLMGAVISQPDSELSLSIDRSNVVDSPHKPLALDLNLDFPASTNEVFNTSGISSVDSLVMIASEASAPQTYVVTNNNAFGPGSLREAIKNANANEGADTIEILSDVILTADILINDDLTINGNGHTITQTGRDRIFYIGDGNANNDLQVSIDNLSLTGGNPLDTGGAIISYEALTITNSFFDGNATTLRGGAIYQENGSLSIVNSKFRNNQISSVSGVSTSAGGAIYALNTNLSIVDSVVRKNQAIAGAITAVFGTKATVSNTLFELNQSTGITVGESDIEVFNSVFIANQSNNSGGGISIENSSTATISGSTFRNNHAVYGGAIEVLNNSDVTITNSTISGNSASVSGGGIDVYDNSTLKVVDSVITGNSSDFGGGIASYDGTSDITLTDTVVTDNALTNLEGDSFTIISTEDLDSDIFGDSEDNAIEGDELDNHIKGYGGDDTIFGGEGDDTVKGNGGDDILYGDRGDDRLIGGAGDDIFIDGEGFNVFKGGEGSDLFIIGEGTNRIIDLELNSDFIGLSDGLSYEDLTLKGDRNTKLFVGDELIAVIKDINKAELSGDNFIEV